MAVEKLLLKPEEAAELLSIDAPALMMLIGSGELASVRIGTSRRIPADALAEFVRELRSPVMNQVATGRRL